MVDIEIDFAKELMTKFGEDRFYHAMLRWGQPRELKLVHLALGGTEQGWIQKCDELRLRMVEEMTSFPIRPDFAEGEAWEAMCRTACTLSVCKEYAMRGKVLPPSIHARMVMGNQNQWTKKYVEWLDT